VNAQEFHALKVLRVERDRYAAAQRKRNPQS
jgi:hypothetical protein